MIRPPIIHLAGGRVKCCGGGHLMDCNGVYRCSCGKDHERRAQAVISAMEKLFGDKSSTRESRTPPRGV